MPEETSVIRWVDIPPERITKWLDNFGERNGRPVPLTVTADGLRAEASNGTVADLTVPFVFDWGAPDGDEGPRHGPAAIGLVLAVRAHALRARRVGVLLVRLGGHAAGVFDGNVLSSSKVGSTYVQGRTAAGGRSQQRFARRRANQADAAREAAADVAARVLLPAAGSLEALVLGGERTSVEKVLADVRLAPLRALATEPRFLTVPDPRQAVLLATPEQFRAVRIRITQLTDQFVDSDS
jgi:hypothetical protein